MSSASISGPGNTRKTGLMYVFVCMTVLISGGFMLTGGTELPLHKHPKPTPTATPFIAPSIAPTTAPTTAPSSAPIRDTSH